MIRIRRPLTAAFIGAFLVGTAACGGSEENASPEESVSAPTSDVPAPAVGAVVHAPTVGAATYDDAAVATFGQPDVDAAYREAVAFASQSTFDPHLINPGNHGFTAADFSTDVDRMTPNMASQYNDLVTKALAGDSAAQDSLQAMSFHSVAGPGATFHASGPLVVDHSISEGQVKVTDDGSGRLAVTFTERGSLRLKHDGSPVLMPMEKTITYFMAPAPAPAGSSTSWLVDGLTGPWHVGATAPDTGSY